MKFDKSSQNLSGKKRKDTQDNTKELQSDVNLQSNHQIML